MSSSSSSLLVCSDALFANPCIPEPPCRVDFDFIEDCALPELPEPIYDCNPPVPPLYEPPPEEFCPVITPGDSVVSVTYLNNCSSNSSIEPTGGIVVSQSSGCDFTIGLNLDIPIPTPPCPVFTTTNKPKINVVFNELGCPIDENEVTITPSPTECGEACEFDINVDLVVPIPKIPCPIFRYANPVTVTTSFVNDACPAPGENQLLVNATPIPGSCSTPDTCQFDIELDLRIPIPKIRCPIFKEENDVTITAEFADDNCGQTKQSKLRVTSTPVPGDCENSDTCEFAIDLELFVPIPLPPCPQIEETQQVSVTSYYTNNSCGFKPSTFKVTTTPVQGDCSTNTPDTCRFDFDLDLRVPLLDPPCPTFNDGEVNVNVYDAGSFVPPSKFSIKPAAQNGDGDCDTPKECAFDIALDLNIPVVTPPCPRIQTRTTTTKLSAGPQFNINTVQFGEPTTDQFNNRCLFDIEFDISLPLIPPFLVFADAQVKYGGDCKSQYELKFTEQAVSFNPATNRWELEVVPELTVPPQPNITPGTFTVSGGLGTGTITLVGDDCNKTINILLNLYTSACSTGGGGGGGGTDPPPSNVCGGTNCTGSCTPGSNGEQRVCSGGGGSCSCIGFLTAALQGDTSFCDDPNIICTDEVVPLCPPGSRCNPYLDF